ncbi:proteasome assembly chaperone family protein [Candidatus Micrarchaeota archaeon]|nr:proteasome assembly chaperone family protein [Candidatus Micrarchaeota archaeon]
MNKTTIKEIKKVKLNKPILIEGLPGIGLVGKLVADLMIDELKGERIADIYSDYFPHQVIMRKSGIIKDTKNEFYLVKRKQGDLLILVGNIQTLTSESQYEVNREIIKYFKKNKGQLIITLGGYGTGNPIEQPKIFGAATDKNVIDTYSKFGIEFGKTRGAIIGAAGLLLSLGRIEKLPGLCIMGETHGGYVDANAAKKMIEILSKMLDIKLSTKKLDKKVSENKKLLEKLREQMEKQPISGGEDLNLSYIR